MPRRPAANQEPYVREVLLRRDRVASFDVYPYAVPAIRELHRLALHPGVTFVVGENGSGKSTLVEAIAICAGMNPEGGSKHFSSSSYRSESSLAEHMVLVRGGRREKAGFFLRAETMFNVATEVEDKQLVAYGWSNLHQRSHGEAFLWVVQERFHGGGLYVLDEPESALSPRRQLELVRHIHDLVADGAQFVIATHAPILMAYPHAYLYELSTGPQPLKRTTLRDTPHFQVTNAVLTRPELTMRELLRDDVPSDDAGD